MKKYIYGLLPLIVLFASCEKFLDAKSSNTLALPSTMTDLRAILDYENDINNFYPGAVEIAADDVFMVHQGFASLMEELQDIHIWKDKGIGGSGWIIPYKAITTVNIVLEGLDRIDGSVREKNLLRGEALFVRGMAHFYLAQIYCAHYQYEDDGDGLGVAIRTNSDVDISTGRSTLRETYERIIDDLTTAVHLLPQQQEYVTRPSKVAGFAALARVYLTIGHFAMAEQMADEVLAIKKDLLNFNDIDENIQNPFNLTNNKEIVYVGQSSTGSAFMLNAHTYVDPALYAKYQDGDRRKHLYFEQGNEGMKFRGFYHGIRTGYFAGLAIDEIYLIKAECRARAEDANGALQWLNDLRRHRLTPETYAPIIESNAQLILLEVLNERRLQLIYRGLRWLDIRRLNRELDKQITLKRTFLTANGEILEYTLPPGDLRFALLIPVDAMVNNNYTQNPR